MTLDVQVVGGPSVIGQLLRAGLVDELAIDVMPVLLGTGLRLFQDRDLEGVGLEKLGLEESGARTSFRFRLLHEPRASLGRIVGADRWGGVLPARYRSLDVTYCRQLPIRSPSTEDQIMLPREDPETGGDWPKPDAKPDDDAPKPDTQPPG